MLPKTKASLFFSLLFLNVIIAFRVHAAQACDTPKVIPLTSSIECGKAPYFIKVQKKHAKSVQWVAAMNGGSFINTSEDSNYASAYYQPSMDEEINRSFALTIRALPFSDSCSVNEFTQAFVVNDKPNVEILGPDTVMLGETDTFYAVGDTNTVHRWDIDNGHIVDTAGALVKFDQAGKAKITLKATSRGGCDSTFTKVVWVMDKTGITSPEQDAVFDIFPNPATKMISLSMKFPVSEPCEINIVNFNGQIIKHIDMYVQSGNSTRSLSIANLPKGIYLLNIKTKSGESIRSFVKE